MSDEIRAATNEGERIEERVLASIEARHTAEEVMRCLRCMGPLHFDESGPGYTHWLCEKHGRQFTQHRRTDAGVLALVAAYRKLWAHQQEILGYVLNLLEQDAERSDKTCSLCGGADECADECAYAVLRARIDVALVP